MARRDGLGLRRINDRHMQGRASITGGLESFDDFRKREFVRDDGLERAAFLLEDGEDRCHILGEIAA